jgi:hypothetical protein
VMCLQSPQILRDSLLFWSKAVCCRMPSSTAMLTSIPCASRDSLALSPFNLALLQLAVNICNSQLWHSLLLLLLLLLRPTGLHS